MLHSPESRVAREEFQHLNLSRSDHPAVSGLDRRQFFGVAAAGIAGALALPAWLHAGDPEDPVGRYLALHPKKIPGIQRITIPILPKKPKRILKIFEQIHYDHNIPHNQRWEVNDCQENLHAAQAFLMQHPAVLMKSMRLEAVCEKEEEQTIKQAVANIAKHIRTAAKMTLGTPRKRFLTGLEYDDPDWYKMANTNIDGYTALGRHGAAEVLHCTRKLQILPAEKRDAKNAAGRARESDPDYWKIVFDQRDKVCIELTHLFDESVTYGCGHRWSAANIHNEQHPDDQIAFMLLTPETVAREYNCPDPQGGVFYDSDVEEQKALAQTRTSGKP